MLTGSFPFAGYRAYGYLHLQLESQFDPVMNFVIFIDLGNINLLTPFLIWFSVLEKKFNHLIYKENIDLIKVPLSERV